MSITTTSSPKTILFLGATGGCGLATLRRSLEAGHTCIALCRSPSKLSDKLPTELQHNLRLEHGNAHDVSVVSRCLVVEDPARPGSRLVDAVVFSIGGAFQFHSLTLDDPHVCETAISVLLEALALCRESGAAGRPRIVVISTTGITELGRDVPLLFVLLYWFMLAVPHKDKKAMEDTLVASAEDWTIVRASLLTDGPVAEGYVIRVGVEDSVARTVESTAIGYTISREDVGKWIFENLVQETDDMWVRKTATITY